METLNYLNTSEEVKQSTQSLIEDWNLILSRIEQGSTRGSDRYKNALREYSDLRQKIEEAIRSENEITRSELEDLRSEFYELKNLSESDNNRRIRENREALSISRKIIFKLLAGEYVLEDDCNLQNTELQHSENISLELQEELNNPNTKYTIKELEQRLTEELSHIKNKNTLTEIVKRKINIHKALRRESINETEAQVNLSDAQMQKEIEELNPFFLEFLKGSDLFFFYEDELEWINSINDLNQNQLISLIEELEGEASLDQQKKELLDILKKKLENYNKKLEINYERTKLKTQIKEQRISEEQKDSKITNEEYKLNDENQETNNSLNTTHKLNIGENWNISIETQNWEKINWISKHEYTIIQKNPEAMENIVNFYDVLEKTGLEELWDIRSEILTAMWSINIKADSNYLDENEVKLFLGRIIKSVWLGELPENSSLEDTVFKIIRINWWNAGWDIAEVNTHGESKIIKLFKDRFVERESIVNGFLFNEFREALNNSNTENTTEEATEI